MHAVTLSSFGNVDVLRWSEVPDPGQPGEGEVLLETVASAVNRADLLQRQGHYPPPRGASDILGLECSGRVAAVGPGVDGWSVGDEVCALLAGGGYASAVLVPAGQLMPVPDGIELITAAGLPEVACTVYSNLFMTAGLADGDTVLLHGGSSGIGTMAIQMVRALRPSARICVTAGSDQKLQRCAELGADVLVNYREQDFVEQVRLATDGRGADVVLDNMGAKYLERNIDVLAPDGRVVVIGMQGGSKAEINLGALLPKRGTVTAKSLRGRPPEQKAEICAAVVREVWPAVADGRIRPIIDRVLPMSDPSEAHSVVESSTHIGKVLLAVP
ncbi:MAG TPA: NAD(P)H-quinone oxidoreductase [Frankiaceae bacterium]|nr:NAD(P)H-quinone oxidoreductase [Frankiaceae bacterium]